MSFGDPANKATMNDIVQALNTNVKQCQKTQNLNSMKVCFFRRATGFTGLPTLPDYPGVFKFPKVFFFSWVFR